MISGELRDMKVISLETTHGPDKSGKEMTLVEIGVGGLFPDGIRALSAGNFFPGEAGKTEVLMFFTYYGMAFHHEDLVDYCDAVE